MPRHHGDLRRQARPALVALERHEAKLRRRARLDARVRYRRHAHDRPALAGTRAA